MKRYRRIEITAFSRRITIVSGEQAAADAKSSKEILLNDADSLEAIELKSAEGQRILSEALRLLEEKLYNRKQKLSIDIINKALGCFKIGDASRKLMSGFLGLSCFIEFSFLSRENFRRTWSIRFFERRENDRD